jgi:hypothetical protein
MKSRVNREVHARFCEGLGVKFPGATRPERRQFVDTHRTGREADIIHCGNARVVFGMVGFDLYRDDASSSSRDPGSIGGWRERRRMYALDPRAALVATVNFFRHERRLGRAGARIWINFAIVVVAMRLAFVAHLIEIALWAGLFVVCGEFQDFGTAYYHSAVNYTTLGYGDLIMSPSGNCWDRWKQQTERLCSGFRPR